MTDLLKSITIAKIYPAIGIARVGNSPTASSDPSGSAREAARGRLQRRTRPDETPGRAISRL